MDSCFASLVVLARHLCSKTSSINICLLDLCRDSVLNNLFTIMSDYHDFVPSVSASPDPRERKKASDMAGDTFVARVRWTHSTAQAIIRDCLTDPSNYTRSEDAGYL